MATIKHTPGPWRVYHVGTFESDANQFRHEFELYTPNTVDHDNSIGNATAKLIAAAPDMLEALQAVMYQIDQGKLVRNIDKDHESDWAMQQIKLVQSLSKAVTAINKATL